jgi:hypothetical protein
VEIYAKEFWLPKRGNTKAEYEDASHCAPDNCRFALADGATETSFSGIWAKQLVRAFTNRKLSVPVAIEELKHLRTKWRQIVHRHELPWYAEEKADAGACAAFLGLEFSEHNSETGTENIWRATATGDSCLVQVRANEILKAFPLGESASFNNCPILLCSRPAFNETGRDDLIMASSGSWGCDDIFLLMTDALACWFFKEHEQGNRPWSVLRDLDAEGHISFEELVSDLRSDGRMRNDDVTLVRIDIFG